MSGLDANEASMIALAHEAQHNSETHNPKDDKGFSFEEKRPSSPSTQDDELSYPDAPTEEEKQTLRRVPGPINLASFLLGYVELAERFSYYGCTVVFTNFIQRGLPEGSTTGSYHGDQRAGALGMGQQAATGLTTFNQFWVYTVPLFGAYIADSYLGRYKTICWSVLVAFIGHVLLVGSAAPSVIAHPNGAIGFFAVSIIIMGLGTGGFKSNIGPIVAEQVASHKLYVKTLRNGDRVLVDPAQTAARMYAWYYMCVNVGALAGQIGMVYAEKNHGFWLAFLLPTIVFATTPIVLWAGRTRYVRTPPTGSTLGKSFRTLGVCFKGKWFNPRKWYADDFWKPAYDLAELPASERPSWATWDRNWVSEVRRGFKACQVFAYFPLYWLTYNQINNNLVSQAAVMNTHGLPNDILNNLDPFALIILIPILDIVIYPALRKAGIRFSPIKRIFAGFMCGSLAMMCAAVTQDQIYKRSLCGRYAATCEAEPFVPGLNVWIQTPSYVLIALSEIFASVTSLEYAYTKAPKSMRSMVMGVNLFTTALAAAIGEAFLPLSEDPNLVWNYGVMAVLSFIGGVFFFINFRGADKEELELNEIKAGAAHAEVTGTNAKEQQV
jgi:POT family proton-dependent oligopeptide transporter